jgi:hypothetical protein
VKIAKVALTVAVQYIKVSNADLVVIFSDQLSKKGPKFFYYFDISEGT